MNRERCVSAVVFVFSTVLSPMRRLAPALRWGLAGTVAGTVLSTSSCSTAKEYYDQVVDGYWSTVEGVIVESKADELVVVEYGNSDLQSKSETFPLGLPWVRSIKRTGSSTFSGDVAVFERDESGAPASVDYTAGTITVAPDNETLTISDGRSEQVLARTSAPGTSSSGSPPGGSSGGNSGPVDCDALIAAGEGFNTKGRVVVADTAHPTTGHSTDGTYENLVVRSSSKKSFYPCVYTIEVLQGDLDSGNVMLTVRFNDGRPKKSMTIKTPGPGAKGIDVVYDLTPNGAYWSNATPFEGELEVTVGLENVHLRLTNVRTMDTYTGQKPRIVSAELDGI